MSWFHEAFTTNKAMNQTTLFSNHKARLSTKQRAKLNKTEVLQDLIADGWSGQSGKGSQKRKSIFDTPIFGALVEETQLDLFKC